MATVMLINVVPPEECRVAVIEDGTLEELYVERTTKESYVGNIYKGRIVNIEPGIQAAFVDFGVGRNGFLHISDVDPQYFPHRPRPSNGSDKKPRLKPPIQSVFRRGQEVVVQVTKESVGQKGPTLSTYISIPGRYLVLMPCLHRLGVSKKITDDQTRRRLRELLRSLNPPRGLGFIVRTAGADRSKRELERDLAYLKRVWAVVQRRIKKLRAPALIYQESDMVIRTIRDIFTADIDLVLIDDPAAYERAREFLAGVMPRYLNRFRLYEDPEPLFHKFGVEQEIETIQQKRVPLEGGGSLVIEPTEALVAIDVNSGNVRVQGDAEQTALKVNLTAAREIARQLRLRDLGGMIVNDFIDMREEKHRRMVERALRDALKRDRARIKVLRMSAFGTIEMTRQRIRPSLQKALFDPCPVCRGIGQVKNAESIAIEAYRQLLVRARRPEVRRIRVVAAAEAASHLANTKRAELLELEQSTGVRIEVTADPDAPPDYLEVKCFDRQDAEIPPEYWAPRIVDKRLIDQYVRKILSQPADQKEAAQQRRKRARTGAAEAAGEGEEQPQAEPATAPVDTESPQGSTKGGRRSTRSRRSRTGTKKAQKQLTVAQAEPTATGGGDGAATAESAIPKRAGAGPDGPDAAQKIARTQGDQSAQGTPESPAPSEPAWIEPGQADDADVTTETSSVETSITDEAVNRVRQWLLADFEGFEPLDSSEESDSNRAPDDAS